VTLPLPNNGTLDALHYGSGSAAVVLAEEYGGDVCQWHFNAQDLATQGYQTVIFNYQGSAATDVLAAIDFVRSQGAKRVFLLGSSKGGTAVLTAASEARPPVSGVVSLSAPKTFEDMNALAPMPTFTTPVIFIIGDNDAAGPDTKLLYQRCASKDKQLIVRPGGFHGVALMDTDTTSLIENFFAGH
jgi:alpha-beta hydrolase superfamily lysophospholipase